MQQKTLILVIANCWGSIPERYQIGIIQHNHTMFNCCNKLYVIHNDLDKHHTMFSVKHSKYACP